MRAMISAAGLLLAASVGSAAAAPAQTTSAVNLRAGPGPSYQVLATIPGGATVDVNGCQGSWCAVAFGGTQGYASANYLSGGGGGDYAPAPAAVVPQAPVYDQGYYGDDYDYGDTDDYGYGYDYPYYGNRWSGVYIAPPVYRNGRWWYNNRWYNTRPYYRQGNRNDYRPGVNNRNPRNYNQNANRNFNNNRNVNNNRSQPQWRGGNRQANQNFRGNGGGGNRAVWVPSGNPNRGASMGAGGRNMGGGGMGGRGGGGGGGRGGGGGGGGGRH